MTEFDYIIAGAGTAGCVLAARLSQDPGTRVLLLEAGGPARTRAMTVPDAWPELLGTAADWAGVTSAQADAGPVAYPRGRALGGSGAINAMAHVRGHRAVYDGWAAGGAAGWGYADLLPYFRRSEHAAGRDPALRGTAGPVRVAPVPEPDRHPVAVAFAESLAQIGCPVTDDLSGARQEGVCWADLAIDGGQRVSPADAYLTPARHRPNLVVRAGCLVTGLQVRHGRCTGVSYLSGGAQAEAHTAGEVIVCAGAVGSPQLLLLSGIGPAGQLRALGIRPGRRPARGRGEPAGPPRRPGVLRGTGAAAPQPVQPRGGLRRAAQRAGGRLSGPAPVPDPAAGRPGRVPGTARRVRAGGLGRRPGQPRHGCGWHRRTRGRHR